MGTSPSPDAFARIPLFVLAAAFAAGVFAYAAGAGLYLAFLLLPIMVTASVFSKRARTFAVISGFVCAGAFVMSFETDGVPPNALSRLYQDGWILSGDPVEIDATLTDQPRADPDGYVVDAAVERILYKREAITTDGIVRLLIKSPPGIGRECRVEELRAGDAVNISLRLKREEPFRNPGTPSFVEALDRKGIAATGVVASCLLIELRSSRRSWLSPFFEFREWMTRTILRTHEPVSAGIVLASLLGNRRFLTGKTGNVFRESGTFHVLVISGLHITIIGGLLLLLSQAVTRNRVLQCVVPNAVLWIYALVVGLEIPVMRAALMFTVFLVSRVINTKADSVNAIGASCLVVLVWRPGDLFSPSFQLTFLSIFAIVGFALPIINKLGETGSWMPSSLHPFPPATGRPLRLFAEALYWSEKRWHDYRERQYWFCEIRKSRIGSFLSDSLLQKAVRKTFEIVFVTASVQVFTLPLLVINFHRVGAGSLVSNIFAGAALVAQNAASILAILISLADVDSAIAFSTVASKVTALSLVLQDAISRYLVQPARVPVYTGSASAVYFLYFVPLAMITFLTAVWSPFESERGVFRDFSRRIALILLATLGAVIIWHPLSRPVPDGRLTVDFLDVGQGDAALVTFPSGETMLVDGGGSGQFGGQGKGSFERDRSRIGEFVVSEFLWEQGYSEVDFLLSTHPDADHIEGLVDVLENFRVGAVFIGGDFEGEPGFDELRTNASANGVPLLKVREGLEMNLGGATVTVLNPGHDREAGPGNGDSVVILIELGIRRVLLTGDIDADAESRMVSAGLLLPADVVKAAHHASRTSSTPEFVEKVRPEYVVVPVGRRSPYGHPHEDVIERWEAGGAKVIVLGLNGATRISTGGRDLRLTGF